jgi:iron(III) transport system permease protein
MNPSSRKFQLQAGDLLFAVVVLFIGYLTILPLVMLIYGSFKSSPPGLPGHFTLTNYAALLRRPEMLASIKNSLIFGLGTSSLAFVGGVYLAWVTERTNMPLKKVVYGSILVPLIVPGLLITVGWIMLFSRRSGLVNLAARHLLGIDEPIELYNMAGMIWVLGIDQIPLAFLLLSASFRSMDPALEEAAVISGTGIVRTTFRITLRILLPAILAVWMISFVRAIENFEVPALVGVPAGILVFATEVYLATHKVPTDFGLASTFAVVYVIVTAIGIVFYLKATKVSERFTTITGKGYRPVAFDLGGWRYPLAAATLVFTFAVFILPVLTVVWSSFLPFYMPPSSEALASVTLDNYRHLFKLPLIDRAFRNSVVLGLSSATIVMLLTAVTAWIVVRTQSRLAGALDFFAFSPIAVPGLVLGIAILWLYLTVPIPIYGTLWILLVAYVIKYMPYGMRACSSSMHQIQKELEEASEVSGASRPYTFTRVLLPLLLPGFIAGWIYVITHSFRELSTSVMLYRSGTEVLAVVMYELWDAGQYPELSALGMTLVVVLVAISLVARWVGGKFSVQQA